VSLRVCVYTALAIAFLGSPGTVEGQSWRTQATWVAGEVAGVALGAEIRRPLGAGAALPLPQSPGRGPVTAPSRSWHVTAMLAGGVNRAAPTPTGRRVEGLAYGHAGLLYRTGRGVPGYIGVLAAGYLPVAVAGAAAYLEAADVAGVQLGALHGDGVWRGHVALTMSVRFIGDILGG